MRLTDFRIGRRAAALPAARAGAALLAGWAALARAAGDMPGGPRVNQLTMADPVTGVARDQQWMHSFLMVVCVMIFIGVFAVMLWSVFKHRKSRGAQPADFHESTAIEIAWTVVPLLIIVAMAVPATRMIIEQKDTSGADLTVKATGYQWRWGYEYLKGEGEGIAFLSSLSTPRDQIEGRAPKSDTYLTEVDHPLVVPVNKKVRIVTTANDVIHSWYVPALGVKQDAIPGFVRDTWFRAEKPGVYRGYCAELCGKEHAFMPVVVEVKSDADYKAWVAAQKQAMAARADDPAKDWPLADLTARGEKVFASNCAACHQASGQGMPGAFPALVGSKVVLGPPPEHIAIILNGRNAMPAWKQLNDVEIAAVIAYTRNAWGNKAEVAMVQPREITAARK